MSNKRTKRGLARLTVNESTLGVQYPDFATLPSRTALTGLEPRVVLLTYGHDAEDMVKLAGNTQGEDQRQSNEYTTKVVDASSFSSH
jgi:hypothetical protein